MKKRILSILLCLCMVVGLLPTMALATEPHDHGTGVSSLSNDMTAGSYYLTDDVTLSSAWTPVDGVTLCLNGYTLTLQAGITVSAGTHLTITNCANTGKIVRDTNLTSSSMFCVNGNLSVDNVTIDGNNVECTSASAVALYVTGGSVSMENGVIENCAKNSDTGHGSAVYMDRGTVSMTNCAIRNNKAKNYGGAVYVYDGTFTMNGGSLTNNRTTLGDATYGGGAIYNRNAVALNNVSLTGNSSTRGGAIYNSSYGTLTITGGSISGNTATSTDNNSNYYGNGIFHSSQEDNTSVLNIRTGADIADEIYLDSTNANKAVKIQSALTKPLNLVCSSTSEGRPIAEGTETYPLTTQDMARISVVNSGWYLKLNETENTIQLTKTQSEAYLPVQLTSADASRVVTLQKDATTVTLTYDSAAGAYTGNVKPGTYQVLVDGTDYKQTIVVSGSSDTFALIAPVTSITFPAVQEGYPEQSAQTVTVINTGSADIASLGVQLDTNSSAFTLSANTISSISAASNSNIATFTVQPNTGLSAGTYTANVTFTGSDSIAPTSVAVSFTVVSSVQDLESVTFSYAYDAQRNPTYPTKNQPVNMSSLAKPLDADGNKDTLNSNGNWTLSRVGTYSYVKTNVQAKAPLGGIVSALATNYSISNPDTVVIHELKNGSDHIAYGVVIAYDAPGGRAVFLGDTWGGSGACYLLSTSEISGTTASINAGTILTDYIPGATYGISLSQTDLYTFSEATVGYGDQTPLTVTVTNTGSAATGGLTIGLTGTGADKFEVSPTAISDIAASSNTNFTVQPKTGLNAGTYTATVTVSGSNIVAKSFNVSFTVNPLGELETVTFGYAYDAQRSPAYPTSGADITFSGLQAPYGPNGSNSDQTSAGSWTLTRAGTYFYLDNTRTISNTLKNLANTIANQYSAQGATDAEKTAFKNSLVIHELKNGDTHYAYGVVVAYNANSGYAAFIGDSLSGSAGYLLSVNALTNSVTTKAYMVATDFVPSLSIALSADGNALTSHTFPGATAGYGEQAALEVTVTNTGNAATGALAVTLTGDNASSFTLCNVDSDFTNGIETVDGTDTFTVKPNTGLAAGTYTATVTVSGTNIVSQSFAVTFTVNPAPVVIPTSYRISVAASENGTVTTNHAYAYGGNTITLTVTPDEGFELDTLTVTTAAGKEIDVTDKADGTYTFKMPYGNVKVEATFKATEVEPEPDPVKDCPKDDTCIAARFTDVDLNAWYHDGVHYCLDKGLMQGTGTTTFEPENPTSRAMLVTVLYRLEGKPEASACNFSDVPAGEWYTDAIAWAAENGIVEGYAGKFEPEANITREQFAAILYRYAKYKGYDVTASADISSFVDGDTTADWAVEAMSWAVAEELLSGIENNQLAPKGDAVRAQMATILYRFCEK